MMMAHKASYFSKEKRRFPMSNRIKYLIVLVVLMATSILAACAQPTEVAVTEKPLSEVSLRLPWIINTQFAGPYVALEKGYFEEEGLKVTINPGGFDVNSITLVAAGTDTFGLHDMGSLLLARAQDMPLIAAAAFFQKHPGAVMALAGSGIATLQDFEGKTIGFQEGGPWMLTKAMLVKNGVDPASMTQVTIGYDLSPLYTDQVQLTTIYATNEPLVAKAAGYEPVVFLPYDYGIETSSEVLFTTDDYMAAHPDVVCAMVRAIRKGWEYAIQPANQEEAVQIIMKYGGSDLNHDTELAQLQAEINHIVTPDSTANGFGYMTQARWQTAEDVLTQQGALEKDVDVTKMFTTQCLSTP
jgi:NitT/TauT family transport system substrate-binding protein